MTASRKIAASAAPNSSRAAGPGTTPAIGEPRHSLARRNNMALMAWIRHVAGWVRAGGSHRPRGAVVRERAVRLSGNARRKNARRSRRQPDSALHRAAAGQTGAAPSETS